MGQYYYGVIIDKNTKEPIMAAYCGKLTESNRADMASFAYELSKGRKGYMQRLVWAGDYSSLKDYNDDTLYHLISEREDKGQAVTSTIQELEDIYETFRNLKGEAYDKAHEDYEKKSESYWMEHIYKANGDLRDDLRYLCNHDRREYMDLNAFLRIGEALALSCSVIPHAASREVATTSFRMTGSITVCGTAAWYLPRRIFQRAIKR